MLRTTLASSRNLRACVLGLVTFTTAIIITSDNAEARRYRQRHYARHHVTHHVARESYSPQFASIIVDGNSGATLSSNNPDGIRHPASLTKIMTLYLLFERLDTGKMKLDTEMDVSERASEQAPTKLGLRPGQTIKVEDAIKGLVTRSANDAAVVIAEAIAADEDDFAKLMTRKARALGMTKTVYRNANGLPNDEQVTTARDQATLGRAIQDRFPRYYRYFATTTFNYRGQSIRNHNRLLGNVEGVDGIKTGYTRASGFNLVTSMRRGNRHLIGVVLGGRSGGSRDATMRNLLAENLERAATTRTVAAITERNSADANTDVAEAAPASRTAEPVQVASAEQASAQATRSIAPAKPSLMAAAAAALPPPQAKSEQSKFEPHAKPEPAPLTSGVIQTQAISAIPGSAEPMKPVRSDGPGQGRSMKLARLACRSRRRSPTHPARPAPKPRRPPAPWWPRPKPSPNDRNPEMTAEPAAAAGQPRHRIRRCPARPLAPRATRVSALAYADPAPRTQPQAIQQNGAIKPVAAAAAAHSGWIIQVGALESEGEARARIDPARNQARGLLSKADPFTETVVAKDNRKLVRARFAGLERDQAEAVCKALKRADISCITVRN